MAASTTAATNRAVAVTESLRAGVEDAASNAAARVESAILVLRERIDGATAHAATMADNAFESMRSNVETSVAEAVTHSSEIRSPVVTKTRPLRMPAMMTGRARGSLIRRRIWRLVMPMAVATSTTAGSTWRMPVTVLRRIGRSA